ncbi:hypothetical protein Pvag_1360 [Pantoea vagans C9-1]|nr:hypothetical protein Pvag_1360 [Pantoea vagans C9-1]
MLHCPIIFQRRQGIIKAKRKNGWGLFQQVKCSG